MRTLLILLVATTMFGATSELSPKSHQTAPAQVWDAMTDNLEEAYFHGTATPATFHPKEAAVQATFHGNIARTGVYDSPGPKQFNAVKWTFKTKGPIVASATVANGVVYIGS